MTRRLWIAAAMSVALAASTARAQVHAPSPTATAKASEGVVNLNDAGEDQLTLLPGIGPAKARAIAEQRRTHPFRRIDELTRVKGIGRKTFGRLRPYITIVGPTTLTSDVKLKR